MTITINLHKPRRGTKVQVMSVNATHWVTVDYGDGIYYTIFTDTLDQAERIAAVMNEMLPAPLPESEDDIPF